MKYALLIYSNLYIYIATATLKASLATYVEDTLKGEQLAKYLTLSNDNANHNPDSSSQVSSSNLKTYVQSKRLVVNPKIRERVYRHGSGRERRRAIRRNQHGGKHQYLHPHPNPSRIRGPSRNIPTHSHPHHQQGWETKIRRKRQRNNMGPNRSGMNRDRGPGKHGPRHGPGQGNMRDGPGQGNMREGPGQGNMRDGPGPGPGGAMHNNRRICPGPNCGRGNGMGAHSNSNGNEPYSNAEYDDTMGGIDVDTDQIYKPEENGQTVEQTAFPEGSSHGHNQNQQYINKEWEDTMADTNIGNDPIYNSNKNEPTIMGSPHDLPGNQNIPAPYNHNQNQPYVNKEWEETMGDESNAGGDQIYNPLPNDNKQPIGAAASTSPPAPATITGESHVPEPETTTSSTTLVLAVIPIKDTTVPASTSSPPPLQNMSIPVPAIVVETTPTSTLADTTTTTTTTTTTSPTTKTTTTESTTTSSTTPTTTTSPTTKTTTTESTTTSSTTPTTIKPAETTTTQATTSTTTTSTTSLTTITTIATQASIGTPEHIIPTTLKTTTLSTSTPSTIPPSSSSTTTQTTSKIPAIVESLQSPFKEKNMAAIINSYEDNSRNNTSSQIPSAQDFRTSSNPSNLNQIDQSYPENKYEHQQHELPDVQNGVNYGYDYSGYSGGDIENGNNYYADLNHMVQPESERKGPRDQYQYAEIPSNNYNTTSNQDGDATTNNKHQENQDYDYNQNSNYGQSPDNSYNDETLNYYESEPGNSVEEERKGPDDTRHSFGIQNSAPGQVSSMSHKKPKYVNKVKKDKKTWINKAAKFFEDPPDFIWGRRNSGNALKLNKFNAICFFIFTPMVFNKTVQY